MKETVRPDRPSRGNSRAEARRAFIRANPRCCYCCGENPTAEVDHAPARICFRNKEGPEGFEFPACSYCNRAVAQSEQVAALYIRFADNNEANFREADFVKLFWGVDNNAREAMPMLDAATSRRFLAGNQSDTSPGAIVIPPVARQHIKLFAQKVLYAMFYRVTGEFVGPKHRNLVLWGQYGTPAAAEVMRRAEEWFGDLEVGSRRNVEMGDQFHYRHGYNREHGFLGLSMTFGQALVFFCVIGPSKHMAKLDAKADRYQAIWRLGFSLKRRAA